MEQQRCCEGPAPCNWGKRRWFQSCMVRPTIGWPRSARMAATVELSTPPLMATAMAFAGNETGCGALASIVDGGGVMESRALISPSPPQAPLKKAIALAAFRPHRELRSRHNQFRRRLLRDRG